MTKYLTSRGEVTDNRNHPDGIIDCICGRCGMSLASHDDNSECLGLDLACEQAEALAQIPATLQNIMIDAPKYYDDIDFAEGSTQYRAPRRFRVQLRREPGRTVRPEAEQLDGKTFEFRFGWNIAAEDRKDYAGEEAWYAVEDPTYPKTAPAWVASGDLVPAD